MKVQAGDLSKALGAVVRLIEPRNVIPVLDCVLLECADGMLTVTSHNLDAHATVVIPLDADLLEKPIAVPGAQLAGLLKDLPPDNEVTLTAAGERLTVSWRKSHYRLSVLPVDTFPPRFAVEGGISFRLDKAGVARLFGEPAPFVAHDKRIYLTGVFLHPDGDKLVGVGCDGVRIYRASHGLPACEGSWPKNGERIGVIVPPKIATEFVRQESDIMFRISDAIIEAQGDRATITSKVIDAAYPAYEKIVPEPADYGFTCNRKELIEVAARLTAVAPPLKDVTPGAGFLWDDTVSVVLSRSPDAADDVITPTEIQGTGRFALQLTHLNSVITALSGEAIHFDIDPGSSVVRITVPGDEGVTCAVARLVWS
jgi:DNA polymerase-3 subunit beta